MAEDSGSKEALTPRYAATDEAKASGNVLTFKCTPGIAKLTPVHIELISAALKRAGATGLKPKWLEKHVSAQLKFEGIEAEKAIEVANAAVVGSGLEIAA